MKTYKSYQHLTGDEKLKKAVDDIRFYLGDDTFKEKSKIFRSHEEITPRDFCIMCSMFLGIRGFPCFAWYKHIWPKTTFNEETFFSRRLTRISGLNNMKTYIPSLTDKLGQFCVIGERSSGSSGTPRRTWFKTPELAAMYAETCLNEMGGTLLIVQAVAETRVDPWKVREAQKRWAAMNRGEIGT